MPLPIISTLSPCITHLQPSSHCQLSVTPPSVPLSQPHQCCGASTSTNHFDASMSTMILIHHNASTSIPSLSLHLHLCLITSIHHPQSSHHQCQLSPSHLTKTPAPSPAALQSQCQHYPSSHTCLNTSIIPPSQREHQRQHQLCIPLPAIHTIPGHLLAVSTPVPAIAFTIPNRHFNTPSPNHFHASTVAISTAVPAVFTQAPTIAQH